MTADEIRKWHVAFEDQNVTAEVARARARIEIAAQLAELNGYLKTIAEIMYADGMAKYGR